MNIHDLPHEIQNKIFYYYAIHPCAQMIKNIFKVVVVASVIDGRDDDGNGSFLKQLMR